MKQVFDLVVDAQVDFMRPHGKLYVPGAERIAQALQGYINRLDSRGVLFTFDTHREGEYEASEEAKEFPIHCIEYSDGWSLAVDPTGTDIPVSIPVYTMEKGVFDMWKEPSLMVRCPAILFNGKVQIDRDVFFDHLKQTGVTTIRVSGVAADYCVKWAIDGLLARGFIVQVMKGLTIGIARGIQQVVREDFAGRPVMLS